MKGKYFDDNNNEITLGDTLNSEWGYKVIVKKEKMGDWYGQLVCDKRHSCKNIPYALNGGKGYKIATKK